MNRRFLRGLTAAAAMIFSLACGSSSTTNEAVENQPAPATPAASPLTGFERDLQFVRNGRFTYVFVFSRKDGKPLDAEDGNFLRTTAPQVVDWVMSDAGKKAIGGTNFNLEEGGMEALKKRFVVEDYSSR